MSRLPSFFLIITVCSLINLSTGEDTEVQEKDYPFIILIAGLARKGIDKRVNRLGTGIMLTPTWTLTAAHIFENLDKTKKEILCVWYGEFQISPFDSNMFNEVFKVFVHPSFRKRPFFFKDLFFNVNDVALMYVSKVDMARVGRLSAVDRAALLGLEAKYVGVAESSVNVSGDDANRKLHFGHGLVTRCGPPVSEVSTNLLCVTPSCQNKESKSNYTGVRGDPLFVDNKIIGVFTMSFFTHSLLWTAFTPIDLYLDWIVNVMSAKNKRFRKSFEIYASDNSTD